MTIDLGKDYLSTAKKLVAGPPMTVKILEAILIVCFFAMFLYVIIYGFTHESIEAVFVGLVACITVLGIGYWTYFTPDNKTLTPDMDGVESLTVFDNSNLEFNDANAKPDSKSVGLITLDDDSNDYKLAKATWDGNHTINVKSVNKSGKAMLTVVNYCRKYKVYKKGIHFKLRSYIYKTTATYTNEQGRVTLTANATKPDKLIRKIEQK